MLLQRVMKLNFTGKKPRSGYYGKYDCPASEGMWYEKEDYYR